MAKQGKTGVTNVLKFGTRKSFTVEGNHYKRLAIAVCKQCHMSLQDALSLTLVEAWLALGAEISG